MSQRTVIPSLVVTEQEIKEKRRGGGTISPPAYVITKYPSLNRVKDIGKSRRPVLDSYLIALKLSQWPRVNKEKSVRQTCRGGWRYPDMWGIQIIYVSILEIAEIKVGKETNYCVNLRCLPSQENLNSEFSA